MANNTSLGHLLALNYVSRWQIIPTSVNQSVAAHSWGVALIALAFVARLKTTTTNARPDASKLLAAALLHDIDEINTGDAPSSVSVAEVKARGTDEISMGNLLRLDLYLLKLADLTEAMWFAQAQINNGGIQQLVVASIDRRLDTAKRELRTLIGADGADAIDQCIDDFTNQDLTKWSTINE